MIHFDLETTSACDIRLGSYRYASDPTTRILMFAVAEDEGEPLLWDFLAPDSEESRAAKDLLDEALHTDSLVYAHNIGFELALCHYRLERDVGTLPPALDRLRCTQAMCRRAAAPESLAKAAEFFRLGDLKDPVGKALIGIFSDQSKQVLMRGGSERRKSASPVLETPVPWQWEMTVGGQSMKVREAWETFKEYCRQDVRVERELHRKLKHFELRGEVLESFQFDLRMNFRGVPVNVEALGNAQRTVEEIQNSMAERFRTLTGLAHSQRDATLEWLAHRGYPEDNLRAATVEKVLGDPPPEMPTEALEALRLRSELSFAALKKIPAMLNSVCPDGHVRGTTQWHAARTGRAGGRIIQPQNFRKTTIGEDTHLCYQMIREGWGAEWFEELWPSPLEAIASSIRHFIQPHEGGFYDGDFVGVENKLLAWVVGDEEELGKMLDGVDMYKDMATKLFGVRYDDVTKDQRTIAKPVTLGCGYGVGGKSLQTALATLHKVNKTRKECNGYVRIYRETHPATVSAWRELEEAAKSAVRRPGVTFHALDGRVDFKAGNVAGINYLTFRLPSGRRLYYPEPRIRDVFKKYDKEDMEEDPRKAEKKGYWVEELSYFGKIQGKTNWGRIATWGSRWLENLCQAMGVDLLDYGCIQAEKAGFDIRMIIHDQVLALQDGRPIEEMLQEFCKVPEWAKTFPQQASGDIVPYYLK